MRARRRFPTLFGVRFPSHDRADHGFVGHPRRTAGKTCERKNTGICRALSGLTDIRSRIRERHPRHPLGRTRARHAIARRSVGSEVLTPLHGCDQVDPSPNTIPTTIAYKCDRQNLRRPEPATAAHLAAGFRWLDVHDPLCRVVTEIIAPQLRTIRAGHKEHTRNRRDMQVRNMC